MDDNNLIEDPNELLGKDLNFTINIGKASLPPEYSNNCFVEYNILVGDNDY